jgi:TPR repeat protein
MVRPEASECGSGPGLRGAGLNPEDRRELRSEFLAQMEMAEAGDAVESLAELYEKGLGVARDVQKAITLYGQAAEKGSGTAKRALKRLST